MSTVEQPGAPPPVLDGRGGSEARGRGTHSPEPGRGISLGSSQIPRICVLREKHTGLTAAPARRPPPRSPAASQIPGPPPSGTCAHLRSSRSSGRARSSGPRLRQGPQRAAWGWWATARGARTSAARARREEPAPPGPAWGGLSGGGGPRRPRPHGRASGRALTQRVVLLKHPLHGGGEEGTQPALGAAELSAPTTTTTTAAAAATTRQAGLPAAGA